MELRQSPEWGKFLQNLGWQTDVIDGCALRIRKLGFLGSIIKIQRPNHLPLNQIEKLAQKHRTLFVKIEPANDSQISELRTQNYQLDSWPLTPPRTIFLDLTKTEEELHKSFSKDTRQTLKKVRGSIRSASWRMADKIQSFDFESLDEQKEVILQEFHQIWRETGSRKHFYIPPYKELLNKVKAFSTKAVLISSWTEPSKIGPGRLLLSHPDAGSGCCCGGLPGSNLVAGCLLLFCDETAYYHHAASTEKGRHLEAPYLVMWQSILEAKKRGAKKFDLEGIFDPRFPSLNKKWLNFSTFKLKWGGQVFEYPGSYVKTYHPLIKLLFRFGG